MVTIKKIAEAAGFSQATVSRLLKGDDSLSIGEETRKKIINTAIELGYDRSKIKTTIEKIALLFWMTNQEELQDLYFHQLRLSIEKYAQINNLDIVTIKHEDGIQALPKNIAGFIGIGGFSSSEIYTFLFENSGLKEKIEAYNQIRNQFFKKHNFLPDDALKNVSISNNVVQVNFDNKSLPNLSLVLSQDNLQKLMDELTYICYPFSFSGDIHQASHTVQ